MGEILLRAMLGGAIVSAFAVAGQIWKPKTFAGLFGSAPSVALATAGIAFAREGTPYVATEARAMVAGAIGLMAYGMACVAVARRPDVPVWLGAGACWLVWGAVTFWGLDGPPLARRRMTPVADPTALARTQPREWLIRFAFGGAVTAATGVVAHAMGPEIGGLFLAFPAILPASLTMVAEHDGRGRAADDARGAVLGALALVAFAIVASLLAGPAGAWLTLTAATGTWLLVAIAAWWIVFGRRAKS